MPIDRRQAMPHRSRARAGSELARALQVCHARLQSSSPAQQPADSFSAMSSLDAQVRETCLKARHAARAVAPRSTSDKNAALAAIAVALEANTPAILEANRLDFEAARNRGTKGALLDRLMLDEPRVAG